MKNARNNSIAWWLPLLALFLGACGSTPTTKAPASATPSLSGDADELAARALATWAAEGGGASQALAPIQKAVQRSPERADLVWLYLRFCMEAAGCEPEAIEAQLRKLDPNNGAVWLGPLARAQARKDTQTVEQILEVMSKSAHINVYWTTSIARLTPPVSRMPGATATPQAAPTPLTNALNETVSWLSRLDLGAFNAISTACDEQAISEPGIRVRCDSIARVLQRSDTTLAEGLGLGIAQRTALPKTEASMRLMEKINTLRYQNRSAGSVVAAQIEKDKFSEQMLKLMGQLPKEQDVSRAILRWAGQPLTPQ